MSDAAFKGAPYGAYTTDELKAFIEKNPQLPETANKMRAELFRREKVAAGDVQVMTDGERLRYAREMEAFAAKGEKMLKAIAGVITAWDQWAESNEKASHERLQAALQVMAESMYAGMPMDMVLEVSIAYLIMRDGAPVPYGIIPDISFDEALIPLRAMTPPNQRTV
jgi:hypothetical protein